MAGPTLDGGVTGGTVRDANRNRDLWERERLVSAPLRGGKTRSKPSKEAFFVRVTGPDDRPEFFNATAYLGKELPYTKPQATCAMRVEDDAVCFSLLHLTKRSAASIVGTPVQMPRGPLARLHRRVTSLEDLTDDVLVVEHGEAVYRMQIIRGDNGVARLEMLAGYGAGDDQDDDVTFELPLGAVQLSLYLRSPRVGRPVAVGFIGHIGKPGTPETLTRAASMVLNSISGLVEFRILSGIETVKVPAPPSKWAYRPPVRKDDERVVFELAANLFSVDYQPVGAGTVVVEIDLENANPTTGRLLYHLNPSENIAAAFADYRAVLDGAVTDVLRRCLGDELAAITYDVVLGEVSSGTLERLREAVAPMRGFDLTPREYRAHDTAPIG